MWSLLIILGEFWDYWFFSISSFTFTLLLLMLMPLLLWPMRVHSQNWIFTIVINISGKIINLFVGCAFFSLAWTASLVFFFYSFLKQIIVNNFKWNRYAFINFSNDSSCYVCFSFYYIRLPSWIEIGNLIKTILFNRLLQILWDYCFNIAQFRSQRIF